MITDKVLVDLIDRRWDTLTDSEKNAFLNSAFTQLSVTQDSDGNYVDSKFKNELPNLYTLDGVAVIEANISDDLRKIYVDSVTRLVSRQVYGDSSASDIQRNSENIATNFYFLLLTASVDLRCETLQLAFIQHSGSKVRKT